MSPSEKPISNLDDDLPHLEALDDLRESARALQKEAINALTAKVYEPRERVNPTKKDKRASWQYPGDDVEKALILRALAKLDPDADNKTNRDTTKKHLLDDFAGITFAESRHTAYPLRPSVDPAAPPDCAQDNVPVFRAALVLHALAESHGGALGDPALYCLYRIIKELVEVAPPVSAAGAARAQDDTLPSAFVTGECARALLAVEAALDATAKAVRILGEEAARVDKYPSPLELWKEHEDAFRAKSLKVSLDPLWPRLIVAPLEADEPLDDYIAVGGRENIDGGGPKNLLGKIKEKLASPKNKDWKRDAGIGVATAPGTDKMIDAVRARFAKVAHDVASDAIDRLIDAVQSAARPTTPIPDDPAGASKEIAKQLDLAKNVISDLLGPVQGFATGIVERELAASSPHLGLPVDEAELVFAAALLGHLSDWNDPKVISAFELARPRLTPHGRLLSIRPFDTLSKGYRLNVAPLEVTRRLADLAANLNVEIEPNFVERLLRPVKDMRAHSEEAPEDAGWAPDPPGRERLSEWWTTALAVHALGSIVHMLDQAINRRIQKHFHVRKPDELDLGLDTLFYPDVGLAMRESKTGRPLASVAMKLQELRAHAGSKQTNDELCSLILYGPPGTGKTTLAEAVAKTAEVPFFEITPSDILVGGAEAVERRARHVFQVLSMLTNAVILFDEFDSILQDRAFRDPNAQITSVFEFLTPGMLPKLKALNGAAKRHRLSYLLATNFIDRLDTAVGRRGRFDSKVGIYPPDAVSRVGRLLDQLQRDEKDIVSLKPRILEAAQCTDGAPMDQIGKGGWFTRPKPKAGTTTVTTVATPAGTAPGAAPTRTAAAAAAAARSAGSAKRASAPAKFAKNLFEFITDETTKPPDVQPETDRATQLEKWKSTLKGKAAAPTSDYWTHWKMVDQWDARLAKVKASGTWEWNSLIDKINGAAGAGAKKAAKAAGKKRRSATSAKKSIR